MHSNVAKSGPPLPRGRTECGSILSKHVRSEHDVRRRYFTANTETAPPCGTSGYLPGNSRLRRLCMRAESTPHPDCTAMNCLPSTSNDTGTPVTPELIGTSHRICPLLASNARNKRSLVPPANNRPPPVASTGPQFCDIAGMLVVHTRLPVSTFHACISPM